MKKTRVFGNASGVTLLKANQSTVAKGSSARISSTFNSGIQNGDIRRAYLADNTVGSVGGPELVTNGTFDTDTSGWTVTTGGSLSIVSGRLRVTNDTYPSNTWVDATQTIATVVGRAYRIAIDAYPGNLANNPYRMSPGSSVVVGVGSSAVFVATTTSTQIVLRPANGSSFIGIGGYCDFDNISVREVVADRSYKANGALITGTLTKTEVAAAADLVAYSGFSNANYLQEPYSADLDFGVGEWSVGAWVNVPTILTDAIFGATPVPVALDTAEWSKGTGWSATGSGSFSCNGSQTGATDMSWVSGNRLTSNSGIIRRWTVTVSAVSGTLVVYSNNGSPFAITSPGTYYGYSNSTNGTEGTAVIRMNGAGQTCIGTLTMDDLSPSRIVERAHTSGPSFRLGLNRQGQLTTTTFDGTTTRTVTTAASYNTATWVKAEAGYTTDGTLSIRVNGVEVAVTRGNPLLTLNNASAVLTIGNSYALDAPFPGSLALLKLGATVPTPEQSLWMYEQEKHMFSAGARVCLPDSGAIVDLTYDEATDKWIAASATNESSWTGLVRTAVTPTPAGSISKVSAGGGVKLQARTTTSPGVDITIPAYGLREELVRRAESAARLSSPLVSYDYVGGFTATTVIGNTAITSVAGLSVPAGVSLIGCTVTGTGIPASTVIQAINGTTIYLSKAATAAGTGVQISLKEFPLPMGMQAKAVLSSGALKQEGATKDYTKLFDGFKECVSFAVVPGYATWVQIQASKEIT